MNSDPRDIFKESTSIIIMTTIMHAFIHTIFGYNVHGHMTSKTHLHGYHSATLLFNPQTVSNLQQS